MRIVAVAGSIFVAAALAGLVVFIALPPAPQSPPLAATSTVRPAVQPAPTLVQADPVAAPPSTVGQSDAESIVTLVRSIFVAVHQANLTGNYSVLRDLGTPAFRDRNSTADLAAIFAPIRNAKIDLGVAVLANPQLAKAELNNQKQLHLAGTLASRPVPTAFELLLQPIDGHWRIEGIAVVPVQPQAAPAKPDPKRKK